MAVSWLKTGQEAKALEQKAEAEAEARREAMDRLWRFWLEKSETCEITFVDGALDPQYNALNQPRFFEHNIYKDGKWGNHYICPEKTDPQAGHKCPLCAGGNQPQLVAVFTIIDHRTFTTKKGITIKDSRKLLVCSGKAFENLNAIAIALKGNGLMGRRFSVTRGKGEQSARVGETFVALDKEPIEELKKKYIRTFERTKDGKKEKVTENSFTVADYEKEFVFLTPDELSKLGFGNPAVAAQQTAPDASSQQATPAGDDFDGVL